MRIALYGGSFNPPHLGHVAAAGSASRELEPDKFLVIPDNIPPHKDMAADSPDAVQRMELCRLAFRQVPGAEISDIELKRSGKSYTADTIRELRQIYPEDELIFVMGTDMLLSFEQWYNFEYLFSNCTIAVFAREGGDDEKLERHIAYLTERYAARIILLRHSPLPMASSDIRQLLPLRLGADLLDDEVYGCIIRNGYYGALPGLDWLRGKAYEYLKPKRIPHVAGCEKEAVRLAERWGVDREKAATAGILHDITKKLNFDEQLNLCDKYGIIFSTAELSYPALLHARTGAALARELFGIADDIFEAIRWHTTGKPDMTLLEKIIYLADGIEPTRDYPSVEKIREAAYEDIDKAMALSLERSLQYIRSRGEEPFTDTAEAYKWYSRINS